MIKFRILNELNALMLEKFKQVLYKNPKLSSKVEMNIKEYFLIKS